MDGLADPRLSIGAQPISDAQPAGTNIRYDSDFLELQEAVAQMESKGPLAVNWRDVAAKGFDILQSRSKDLLVASYVALALSRTEGYRGLAIGLCVIADMAGAFWPEMQPPAARERARVQMLEWLVQRVVPFFAEQPPTEADGPQVIAGYAALERLQDILDEKLVKESAALGDLVRLLRDHAREAERVLTEKQQAAAPPPAPAPPAAAPSAPPAAVPPAAAPPPAPAPTSPPPAAAPPAPPSSPPVVIPAATAVAPPGDSAAIDIALSRLQGVMLDVAKGIRAVDDRDPRGYVMSRQAIWCTLLHSPPNQRGRTMLAPPPGDRLTQVALLQRDGNHTAAVAAIEENIASAPFWLDAHRLAVTSLTELGAGYEPARLAVAASLGSLIGRLPDLPDLSFANGTPFADPATRKWIAEEVSGSKTERGGSVSATAEAPWVTAVGEARERARAGQRQDGMALLARGVAGAPTARERFIWQATQAEYCLEFGMVMPAMALLDHLDEVIERYNVEEWDPSLAVRVSGLMHQCLMHADARGLRSDEIRLPQLAAHRARLCRLDMVAAAEVLNL
jgi:type VI secretion system protein VasJ